jgi:pimeloyl-ACP methyl ester carboxylesterase
LSKSEDSLSRVVVHLLFMANAGLYSTCDSDPIQAAEAEKVWQALQTDPLTLSSDSRLMVAEVSGHNIQLDQPGLVVEVIQEMVE